jgi:tetratricopeptide (TPR) repeat protein
MPFRKKIALIVFGFILTFLILEISLRIAGFALSSIQDYKNYLSLQHKGTYRIMCLGESTTQGQYPAFLEEILNQRKLGIKFTVIDKGRIGAITSEIARNIKSYLDEYHPDMVIALIGINDKGLHMPYETPTSSGVILFIRSFKTYKLFKLLKLHITAKIEGVKYRLNILTCAFNSRKRQSYNDMVSGWKYYEQNNLPQAEASFKKAIELNARNNGAYDGLGWTYYRQGNLAEAEVSFKNTTALNSRNDDAYVGLIMVFMAQNKLKETEEFAVKAIKINPRLTDRMFGLQARLYAQRGQLQLAASYFSKANELRDKEYNPATAWNYRKLKEILDKCGIILVCTQYPMRSVSSLKKIFGDNAQDMIFVDNENIFKEAVKKYGYEKYFRDAFGGDFSHCTPEGNRLLAENIADVILKAFHK